LINTTVVVSKTFVEMYEINYVPNKIIIPNVAKRLHYMQNIS
jgi:hypothetical protein